MYFGAARVPETIEPAVVRFPAEVDLSNGDRLLAEALRRLRAGAPGLVLDLSGCAFCDSSGPNAIFRAKVRADAAGVPLLVVLPESGIVRRICDIAGVTRRVTIASDLESALGRLAASGKRPGVASKPPAKQSPASEEPANPVRTTPSRPTPATNGRHRPGEGRPAT